ncbi:MAG: ATP-binding protein [Methylococcales bacterium]|nr:ATP-binding protein [Methylococcales bacterium]
MNYTNLIISSRFENTRLAALCATEVASRSFNSEALNEIELSIVELVNNCIEHAYEESVNQQVSIEFKLFKDHLIIEVTDNGKALDPSILDNMNGSFDFDPDDLDNLPEGGFGLNIIKASMDEVKYERLNDKNHWLLTKFC